MDQGAETAVGQAQGHALESRTKRSAEILNPDELTLWRSGDPIDNGERWAPMPGFETSYLVSTLGRVIRILGGRGSTPGRIVAPSKNADGYPTLTLCNAPSRRTYNLHKLVALAFLGPVPSDIAGDFEVHHRNADRADCRAANLAFVSAYENEMDKQHRRYTGRG